MKNKPSLDATLYADYKKNKDEIIKLDEEINKLYDDIGKESGSESKQKEIIKTKQKKIEQYKNDNIKIIKEVEKKLFETKLIKSLKKDLRSIKLSPQEEIEYENLAKFYKGVISYDSEREKKECTSGIYNCFMQRYKEAKAYVDRQKRKFIDIISLYVELIDRSPYTKENFTKYIERFKRLIQSKRDIVMLDDPQSNPQQKPKAEITPTNDTSTNTTLSISPRLTAENTNSPSQSKQSDAIPNNTTITVSNGDASRDPQQDARILGSPDIGLPVNPTQSQYPNAPPYMNTRIPVASESDIGRKHADDLIKPLTETAQEEADRKAQEEAAKEADAANVKAQEEGDRKAQEAEEKAKQEAEEKAKQEAEKKEKQEVEEKEKQEVEEKEKQEAEDEDLEKLIEKMGDDNLKFVKDAHNSFKSDNSDNKLKTLLHNLMTYNLQKIRGEPQIYDKFKKYLEIIIKKYAHKDALQGILNNIDFYNNCFKYNIKLLIYTAKKLHNINLNADIVAMLLSNGIYYHFDINEIDTINKLKFNIEKNSLLNNKNVIKKKKYYSDKLNVNQSLQYNDERIAKTFIMSFYTIINQGYFKNAITNHTLYSILMVIFQMFVNNKATLFNQKNKENRRHGYKNEFDIEKLRNKFIEDTNLSNALLNGQSKTPSIPHLEPPETVEQSVQKTGEEQEKTNQSDEQPYANLSSGGALDNAIDKTLMNADESRFDEYVDQIQGWIEKYADFRDGLLKLSEEFNDKLNSFSETIKTLLDQVDSETFKKSDYDVSKIKQQVYEMKSTVSTFDTSYSISSFITFLKNYDEHSDTVLKTIKDNKTLKKFKEKQFDSFKEVIYEHKRFITNKKNDITALNKALDYSSFKNIISSIESIISISNNINDIVDDEKDKRYNAKYINKIREYVNDLKSKIQSMFNNVNGKSISNKNDSSNDVIVDFLNKLRDAIKHRNKTAISKVVSSSEQSEFSAANTPSKYQKIWERYLTDINDQDKLIEDAQDKLYTAFKSNNLDPQTALALTREDRFLFILIIFIIRQIVLSIIDYIIDKDIITSLWVALVCYVGIYVGILFVILIIVNLDDYKLRVVLNYFNMHVNSHGITMHIMLVSGFTAILYYLVYSMNYNVDNKERTVISEVEKLRLIYKIELMTIAVFVFVAASDLLISW